MWNKQPPVLYENTAILNIHIMEMSSYHMTSWAAVMNEPHWLIFTNGKEKWLSEALKHKK